MNAAVIKAKPTPTPRSAVALEADIATLERQLMETRRADSTARTSLPAFMAQGDSDGIADCQKVMRFAETKIASLVATLEQTREALKVAKARDRTAARAQVYKEIRQSALASQQKLNALAEVIANIGPAFDGALDGLQALTAQTTRAGVKPEPYEHPHLLHKEMGVLVEQSIWLATHGVIGKSRTLNGTTDLALGVAPGSVLRRAASESVALTMQRVQSALQLHHEPE